MINPENGLENHSEVIGGEITLNIRSHLSLCDSGQASDSFQSSEDSLDSFEGSPESGVVTAIITQNKHKKLKVRSISDCSENDEGVCIFLHFRPLSYGH